ncbi:olfactory receptor 14A16-like [Alligator mississippiensis]|uniref:olfactory receptor 14A16-like n=1 Tax=Alligator mississippiensis TaxID=8496 RepID=UPI002877798C|nr:olfactory receptor 14A16-like [Alligator mississippiensis]
MPNCTTVTEFLLLGFSDTRELQILHFVIFLAAYLAALVGNLLVITVVTMDHHLQSPMYCFLVNFSILDLGSISVTMPKSIFNSLLNTRQISYAGCVSQVFLFSLYCAADVAFLTIMAYDRYIAICKPLHYEIIINRTACIWMAACAWAAGVIYSALHTGNTFSLPFCHSNTINQFFCEIPQLLKLSCSDAYCRELAALAFSVCLALGCFVFIIVSYVQIFTAVWRIPSEQGRQKAFSTCIPHLIVVSLFLSTGGIAYLKPISDSPSPVDLLAAVLYSVVPPLMNPVIYSMRNKEIQAALRKLLHRVNGKLMFPLCRTCAEKNQPKCTHTDEERVLLGTWCTPELNKGITKGYKVAKIYEVWHFPEMTYDISSCDFTDDETACVSWKHSKERYTLSGNTNILIMCFATACACLELYELLDSLQDRCPYHDTDSDFS